MRTLGVWTCSRLNSRYHPPDLSEHKYGHSALGFLYHRDPECVCHVVVHSVPEVDGEGGGYVAEKNVQDHFLEKEDGPASAEL